MIRYVEIRLKIHMIVERFERDVKWKKNFPCKTASWKLNCVLPKSSRIKNTKIVVCDAVVNIQVIKVTTLILGYANTLVTFRQIHVSIPSDRHQVPKLAIYHEILQ